MATMQIPIPALMPVISRGTIEEEASNMETRGFLGPRLSRPLTLDGMPSLFFLSRRFYVRESFVHEETTTLCETRCVFVDVESFRDDGRLA